MAVPCLCAAVGLLGRIEDSCDRAGQFGMLDIDAGIDHRNQHIVAFGEGVRLRQMQPGEFILRRVTFAFGCAADLVVGSFCCSVNR